MNKSADPTTHLPQNTTKPSQEPVDYFRTIEFWPQIIIIIVGTFGNLSIIYNGLKKRAILQHYFSYFVLSLAFADLGVVLMAIPVNLVEYTVGLNVDHFTCAFILPIRETFQCAGVQSVAVLAIMRLRIVTKFPHVEISRKRCIFIIAAIWLSGYFLVSLPFSFIYKSMSGGRICDPQYTNPVLKKILLTFISVLLLLSLAVATLSYLIIIKKMNNALNMENGSETRTVPRASKNLSILVLLLIFTCYLSYLPLAIQILAYTYEVSLKFSKMWKSIISVLFFSSSAINPMLVLVMKREYRFKMPRRRLGRVGIMMSSLKRSKARDQVFVVHQ